MHSRPERGVEGMEEGGGGGLVMGKMVNQFYICAEFDLFSTTGLRSLGNSEMKMKSGEVG